MPKKPPRKKVLVQVPLTVLLDNPPNIHQNGPVLHQVQVPLHLKILIDNPLNSYAHLNVPVLPL